MAVTNFEALSFIATIATFTVIPGSADYVFSTDPLAVAEFTEICIQL